MSFWKKQIGYEGAIVIICIGLLLLAFSIFYLSRDIRNIHHYYVIRHRTDVNLIQSWMTLRYISGSYGVPESLLLKTARITTQQARHESLNNIAKTHKESSMQIIQAIRAVIIQYKARMMTITPVPS